MEYPRWAPQYERIRSEFGFPFEREELAARALLRLLPAEARIDPLARLSRRLGGRTAIVVGLAPEAGPPPIWRVPPGTRPPAIVAADGATAACLGAGLVPDVITTDLDGPVPSEVAANRRGSLTLVHGHGDNLLQLDTWLPEFPGELAGSWAGPPKEGLVNVGGFTDGDRGVFLAEACGAERVLLWGFDFGRVREATAERRALKLAKLAWAERLITDLARGSRIPIERWAPDGSFTPYPSAR